MEQAPMTFREIPPEVTPAQAAFFMRHLSDDDRDRLIAAHPERVIDMRDAFREYPVEVR
jgi:hypothetical protein